MHCSCTDPAPAHGHPSRPCAQTAQPHGANTYVSNVHVGFARPIHHRNTAATTPEDLRETICGHECESETRPWVLSSFGIHCPVAFKESSTFVTGSAQFVATYGNAIFVFESKENELKFKFAPRYYLRQQLHTVGRFVFVYSSASDQSDVRSAVAKLAAQWDVPLISFDQLRQGAPAQWLSVAHASALSASALPQAPHGPTHLVVLASADSSDDTSAVTQLGVELSLTVLNVNLPSLDDPLIKPRVGAPTRAVVIADAIQVAVNGGLMPLATEAVHDNSSLEEEDDHRYGDTQNYCPVTLNTKHVLRPTRSDFAALYRGLYYHFATNEERAQFIKSPHTFAPESYAASLPAPRIAIIGPAAAGKTTQGRKIARRLRLFHISFLDRVREVATMPSHPDREAIELHLATPEEVPLSAEIAFNIARVFWTEEPYKSTGFVLEGYPRNSEDAKLITDENLFVDVCFNLTITEETAVKRIFPKRFEKFTTERNAEIARRDAAAKAKAGTENVYCYLSCS